jgi:hypothetical protein
MGVYIYIYKLARKIVKVLRYKSINEISGLDLSTARPRCGPLKRMEVRALSLPVLRTRGIYPSLSDIHDSVESSTERGSLGEKC